MLRRIEAANLFLIPLDTARRSYRYHALFGDALRRYLGREYATKFVQRLHRRAAAWYASESFLHDAIEHALRGADMEQAGEFIERAARAAWMRGERISLLGWLERLPVIVILERPRLCLFSAWGLIAANRVREADQRLVDAEMALQKFPCSSCEGSTPEATRLHTDMLAELMTLRATVARLQGDAAQTIALARQALEFVAQDDAILRSIIVLNQGHAYRLRGDVKAATAAFQESVTQGRFKQNIHTVLLAKKLLTELNPRMQQSSDQSGGGIKHLETGQGTIQLLSKREVDILCRLAQGLSNQAIADEMMVELSTVKSHLKHIYRKLNVESRTQAIALARELDLL